MTKNLTKPLAFLSAAAMLVTMLLYLPGSVFSNIGLELTANAEEITPTEPSTDADGVYQIGTAAELYWFANAVNSGNNSASAKLTESITVNDSLLALLEYDAEGNVTNGGSFISWTPICRTGYYTGTFDGNGKSVSGLFFDDSTVNYVGLFGYIGSGKITNVSIADSYIRGKQYVGGVCGRNTSGVIKKCGSSGKIIGTSFVGGVCGNNDSFSSGGLNDCFNEAAVKGTDKDIGGVCGDNSGAVLNCRNFGDVSGNSSVGGVCGANSGTVSTSYSFGAVNGEDYYIGGVCGSNNGISNNCHNLGNVGGKTSVGGVCGYNGGTAANCYSLGEVSGSDNIGGVCGWNSSSMANCYFNSTKYTGDAVGYNYSSATAVDVSGKEAESFENGETAYLLSQGCTIDEEGYNGSVWGQNIGTDKYPVTGGDEVYRNEAFIGCIDAPGKMIYVYANTEAEAVYSEHTYENGFCKYCKKLDTPVQDKDGVYQISNAGQLYWFAGLVNGTLDGVEQNSYAAAKLTEDITVNENLIESLAYDKDGNVSNGASFISWTPIGKPSSVFRGTFDGNGKTVSGLFFDDSTADYVGLLGYLSCGEIKKVGVVDSYMNGEGCVGGVCGYATSGTITDCYNTGIVSGAASNVGGVSGFNTYCTITGCYNTGALSGKYCVGGLLGDNGHCTTTNCYNTGEVTSNGQYSPVGGVCGDNSGDLINCYNTGKVNEKGDYGIAGGVSGENTGNIINCFNTGRLNVTGMYTDADRLGGVCGWNKDAAINNCYYIEKLIYDSDAKEKTSVQFSNGEVAYLLSQGCTIGEGEEAKTYDGSVWGQKLGTDGDEHPVLNGDKVYQNEIYPGCIHEPGTLGYIYENQSNDTAYASFTEVTDEAVEPTCTETGLTAGSHCSVCGKVFVEQQTRPENGHDYQETAVAPTYGAEGYTLHTCSVCGASYKDAYTNKKTVPAAAISSNYTSTGTSITLNWAKVEGVTGYKVYSYDKENSKWVLVKTVEGADTLYTTVTDLTPGSVTKFKVNAYAVEKGKTYYGAASTFLDAAALAKAKISSDYTSTGTSITLNWDKVEGATGYKVYRYNSASKKWVAAKTVTGENTLSAVITGVTPGSVIKYKVNAYVVKSGKTYFGTTSTFLNAAALANAKISSDYTSTGTSFTLNWGKVTGAKGYNIYKYNGATGKWVLVDTVTGGDTLSATVSGFTPGSVIKFRVSACLTVGSNTYEGGSDNSIYAAALGAASFKESYTAEKTYALVSWNKVQGATGYKIYKYDSANKKWVVAKTITDTTKTSTYVTGLNSGTTTKLKINAYLTKGTKTYVGKAGTMLSVTTK